MKRLNRRSAVWGGVIAINLVIFMTLVAVIVHQNNQIQKITLSDKNQAEQLSKLTQRIGEYTYSPHSLSECLNTAATEYTNTIKKSGDVVTQPGKDSSYSLSSAEWRKADEKLKASEADCKVLFDK